jgi:serine/threonine protein phosphatase PrpC
MTVSSATQVAALWGDEHERLGEIATASLEPCAAIALSRGRFPKAYDHVDPNEDAIMVAGGPAGWVLAVADGHNGFDAARAALGAVALEVAPMLATEVGDPAAAVAGLFELARQAVARDLDGLRRPRSASRTALSVALVAGERLCTASLGDTLVVRVRGRRLAEVGQTGPFLGPDTPPPEPRSVELRPGDVVLAASDGLLDFVGATWTERLVEAGRVPDRSAAVRGLVLNAFAGGAGDNVAVGLLARGLPIPAP